MNMRNATENDSVKRRIDGFGPRMWWWVVWCGVVVWWGVVQCSGQTPHRWLWSSHVVVWWYGGCGGMVGCGAVVWSNAASMVSVLACFYTARLFIGKRFRPYPLSTFSVPSMRVFYLLHSSSSLPLYPTVSCFFTSSTVPPASIYNLSTLRILNLSAPCTLIYYLSTLSSRSLTVLLFRPFT